MKTKQKNLTCKKHKRKRRRRIARQLGNGEPRGARFAFSAVVVL